jgi:uncharacterized membrane protein YeaQ/YmgE (transglycosylase-associated protein family)
MDSISILVACAIGIIAGWLAGLVVRGSGGGLLRDLVIGLLGGVIGHLLISRFDIGLPAGYPGAMITAFGGAVILLLIFRLIAK